MNNTEKVDVVESIENSDIEKGYVTGFFDAEGTVRLEPDGLSWLGITQAYKPVLFYIKEKFKVGNVGIHSRQGYDKRGVYSRGASRWRITSERIIPFLEYIYENSIEKRNQVELMLQYLKEIKPHHGWSLTESQRNTRNWFVSELERLKKERENHIPEMPENVLLGYFSGFFDGEGHVEIQKSGNSYTLRIQTSNSNITILNMFKDKFGGKVRDLNDGKNYQWYIDSEEGLKFLKSIYSHTKVKKNEIKYAIEFQEWHNDIRIIRTPEHKKKADWYYNVLRELKKCTDDNIPEWCKQYEESIQTEDDIIKSQMTLEKARLIRNYYVKNPITYKEMSEIFGEHIATIGRVLNNQLWTDENAPSAPNKMRKVPKHSLEEAIKIREDYSKGNVSCHRLAKIYDTTPSTICNIINNKVFKQDNYNPPKIRLDGENNSQAKLTWNIVNIIRERYKNDKTLKHSDLAKEYNISRQAVSLILENKRWIDNNYKPDLTEQRFHVPSTIILEDVIPYKESPNKLKEDSIKNTNISEQKTETETKRRIFKIRMKNTNI